MEQVQIGATSVSRLILGSNPFSGFSHQSPQTDREMMRYFTTERIKATLRQAEALGVNTLIARTDHHVLRFLLDAPKSAITRPVSRAQSHSALGPATFMAA